VTMTELEIKRIVRETVEETLTSLGVDHDDPIEMQKDFQHLRDWRQSVDAVRSKGIMTAFGVLIAGIIGALWVGIKDIMLMHNQ